MTIILAEALTALLYLFLGLSLPWSSWQSLAGTLRDLHFILVIAAAIATAWGTARHRPWAPKGAVVLAAYVGLPNLVALGSLAQYLGSELPTPTLLSLLFVFLATVLQLVTFVLALRQWPQSDAAA